MILTSNHKNDEKENTKKKHTSNSKYSIYIFFVSGIAYMSQCVKFS